MTSCETLATDIATAMQTYADALTVSGIVIFAMGILAGLMIAGLFIRRDQEEANA